MRWLTFVLGLALTACESPPAPAAHPVARYRPHTAQRPERSTAAAVVVGEGDQKDLAGVGGATLGYLLYAARGELEQEPIIEGEARALAGDYGGTHIMQTAGETQQRLESARGGARPVSYQVVRFVVLAVPRHRWSELPPALRPTPLPPPPPPPAAAPPGVAPAPRAPPNAPPTAPPKAPPVRSRLPSDDGF
ncbi:MAG TPA: hypothetical protein VFS00_26540 [Polyangiaceae bacterium]|nr:hypothetical protein [Polyangiaceae bacterium]